MSLQQHAIACGRGCTNKTEVRDKEHSNEPMQMVWWKIELRKTKAIANLGLVVGNRELRRLVHHQAAVLSSPTVSSARRGDSASLQWEAECREGMP